MKQQVLFVSLQLTLAGCQKVQFGSVPIVLPELKPSPTPISSITPTLRPVVQMAATATPQTPSLPSVALNLHRFENSSWFKSCFWITVNGRYDDSSFVGCNKGTKLIGSIQTIRLDSLIEKSKCPQLGVRAEVYRNTENCTSQAACSDASYGKIPSFVRSSSNGTVESQTAGSPQASASPSTAFSPLPVVASTSSPSATVIPSDSPAPTSLLQPFIISKRGSEAAIDSRVVLTDELLALNSEWFDTKKFDPEKIVFRVFFEDQDDAGFSRTNSSANGTQNSAIDYNDVVFDLSFAKGIVIGFDQSAQKCP